MLEWDLKCIPREVTQARICSYDQDLTEALYSSCYQIPEVNEVQEESSTMHTKNIFFVFVQFVLLLVGESFRVTNSRLAQRSMSLQMSADQQGRVTMYKREGCPYCVKARELLEGKYDLSITFVDIEAPER